MGPWNSGVGKRQEYGREVKTAPTKLVENTGDIPEAEEPWKQRCATGLGGNGRAGSSLRAHCVPNPEREPGNTYPPNPELDERR